jgi:nitrate ABC transporter ATP-binding subunit
MLEYRPAGGLAAAGTTVQERRPYLQLRSVEKSFRSGRHRVQVLAPIDIAIEYGAFVTLIGPSGCGKSTLLNLVAGLVEPDRGELWLDDAPVDGPGRDRGVVFQHHVLLPWLTARDNVLFALDCARRDLSTAARRELADQYLKLVHLGHAASRRPGQLSGGMQQRVGIARAFALQPKVLLLDEPFGSLDALTRLSLQRELVRLWETERRTVLMVTHDVDEALLLSDRIIVMSHGPSAQILCDVKIPFPRPRDPDQLARSPAYYDLRASLLAALAVEVAQTFEEEPDNDRPQ